MDTLLNTLFLIGFAIFVPWFIYALGVEVGKGRARDEFARFRDQREEAKRKEQQSGATRELDNAVAEDILVAEISAKKPPSSKNFCDAARARPAGPSAGTEAAMSVPRVVPVSYPKQAVESAEKQTRSRMFRNILTNASKPLPVAEALDGLLLSQEALIDIDVVQERWQPLVDFAQNIRKQVQSSCDLRSLGRVRGILVDCDLKGQLQAVDGISVRSGVSFEFEVRSKYGPIDRDGFCDAIAIKDGTRLPLEEALLFEPSVDGALAALFIHVALPGYWAWGHGMYDRDQQLVTTLDSAIAILQQSSISPDDAELRKLTTRPGIRVSRRNGAIEVGCLAYRPGKGFSDIVVTIEAGQISMTGERVLFHWGRGILY